MPSAKKMNKANINKVLHLIGSGLAILGVFFVITRLHSYWDGSHFDNMNISSWMFIVLLSFFYGATNSLLSFSWKKILEHCNTHVSFKWAIKTYGISQLAKYVPGNVFHIAGRQALAMADGFSSKEVLKSNIYELILISLAGSTSIFLITHIIFPSLTTSLSIILFLSSLIIVNWLLRFFLSPAMSTAFMIQIVFLICSSVIFTVILGFIIHKQAINYEILICISGAYTIAWLAGLITPGAPAGVGIRELVIVFFLKNYFPESELLLSVVLGRIVTVVGDVFFYSYAYFISKKHNKETMQ